MHPVLAQIFLKQPFSLSINLLNTRILSRVRLAISTLVISAEDGLISLGTGDVSRWDPLMTVPSLKTLLTIHEIDILQTELSRFEEEEPDEKSSSQVGSNQDETKSILDASVGDRREESDHPYYGC